MKVRNGFLALLAVLALAGCGADTAPTEPGAVPNLSAGGIITIGWATRSTHLRETTDSAVARGILPWFRQLTRLKQRRRVSPLRCKPPNESHGKHLDQLPISGSSGCVQQYGKRLRPSSG